MVIRQVGGLASLVATVAIPIGVQFRYHEHAFTITWAETRVVNNVRMTNMVAECSETGKFVFIIHKEVLRTGVANEFAFN